MTLLIGLAVAVVLFLFIGGLFRLLNAPAEERRERVRGRLDSLANSRSENAGVNIIRSQPVSNVKWVEKAFGKVGWFRRLRKTIRQAGAKGTPTRYILTGMSLGLAGFMLAMVLTGNLIVALPVGVLFLLVPFWLLKRKKAKRMNRFDEQLPDALDLIARSLRAGHTFAGGMRMAADEFDEPLGPEFGKTLDEINFGIESDRALANLLDRVDSTDLKFFVVSVNIQRETGGNLSEIVGNIASLVRERFKLYGKVRVLSAEGRLSAMILLALPFIIAVVIHFLNPDYLVLLFVEPVGRILLYCALGSMLFGYLVIRKMVQIKV